MNMAIDIGQDEVGVDGAAFGFTVVRYVKVCLTSVAPLHGEKNPREKARGRTWRADELARLVFLLQRLLDHLLKLQWSFIGVVAVF